MPYIEPRPKREHIPDDADPADVLYELRQFRYDWSVWRAEVNGDLAFLKRFRAACNDTIHAAAVVIPIGGFILAVLLALRVL